MFHDFQGFKSFILTKKHHCGVGAATLKATRQGLLQASSPTHDSCSLLQLMLHMLWHDSVVVSVAAHCTDVRRKKDCVNAVEDKRTINKMSEKIENDLQSQQFADCMNDFKNKFKKIWCSF